MVMRILDAIDDRVGIPRAERPVSILLFPSAPPDGLLVSPPPAFRARDVQHIRSPITSDRLFAATRVKATGIVPTLRTMSTALGYALLSLRPPRRRFCLLMAYGTIVPFNLLVVTGANSHSDYRCDPGLRLGLHD